MIVGQEELLNKINTYTLDNFPHSLILVGAKGSGKNLICDYIANHLNIEIIDITKSQTLLSD